MINSMETENGNHPENPEERAHFLSKLTFLWLIDLFKFGRHNQINESHIYQVPKQNSSEKLSSSFNKFWTREIERGTNNLWNVIRTFYGCKILFLGLFHSIVETFCRIYQPQCLGGLILYFSLNHTSISINQAYCYAGGIILCSIISAIVSHPIKRCLLNTGLQIRVACCSLLYEKVLKLKSSTSSSVEKLNEQIVNLMTNTETNFDKAVAGFHETYKVPIETLLLSYFIFREIGLCGIFGVALIIICFVPFQFWIDKKSTICQLKTYVRTENRVRLMSEIIERIKLIKMYTWEQYFGKVINKIRCKEVKGIRGIFYRRAIIHSFDIVSKLAMYLSLVTYLHTDNRFAANKVFIIMSYYYYLYNSLLQVWSPAINSVFHGFDSIRRIQELLLYNEEKIVPKDCNDYDIGKTKIDENSEKHAHDKLLPETVPTTTKTDSKRVVNKNLENKGIIFRKAATTWLNHKMEEHSLFLDDLRFQKNGLHIIAGHENEESSSLLKIVLNELDLDKGEIEINGTVSYASRTPWTLETTIQRNIIFNEKYDEERYKQVLKVCDLENEISECESSMAKKSSDEKARISLARCLYKNADIYLLDDPLVTVDINLRKHIFEQSIKGFLKNKICVLVTCQFEYLNYADTITIINNGYVEAHGSYRELKAQNLTLLTKDENSNESADNEIHKSSSSLSGPNNQPTITNPNDGIETNQNQNWMASSMEENQTIGKVGLNVFQRYLQSVDNMPVVFFVGLLFVLAQAATSGVDYFIAQWVNREELPKLIDESNHNSTFMNIDLDQYNNSIATTPNKTSVIEINQDNWTNRSIFISFYSNLMMFLLYFTIHRSFAFFKMCLRASINLHDKLLWSINRATMTFFAKNTSVRILDRFSKDIYVIDMLLPIALFDCILFFLRLVGIFAVITFVNYWFLLPTIIMMLTLYTLSNLFTNTASRLKKIELSTRSPIYSHVNATYQGLTTIHSTNAEKLLINEFHKHTDLNTSANYLYVAATRAFGMWLELICVIYVSTIILSFMLFNQQNDTMGGNVGLAISQALSLIFFCHWGIEKFAELKDQMISFERVQQCYKINSEPPLITPNKKRPDKGWPHHGRIIFENFYLKYSPEGDYVLKDLNFRINPTEKIGIVGAGKSSIAEALFRLAINEGTIQIDDIDIESLGLQELRRTFSIIPKDPVLFSGTIRSNLDPFEEKSDSEIWNVLNQIELKQKISMMPEGLLTNVLYDGNNFSVGERQLICLARAMLRKNKFLILMTAAVKQETDYLIQKTIRQKFSQCTVLIITNRLHSIMDSDKVLVLDEGRIIEFGHPYELIQNSRGVFRQMLDKTGLSTSIELIKIAEKNYFTKRN